eukprot:Pgem_evm1s3325
MVQVQNKFHRNTEEFDNDVNRQGNTLTNNITETNFNIGYTFKTHSFYDCDDDDNESFGIFNNVSDINKRPLFHNMLDHVHSPQKNKRSELCKNSYAFSRSNIRPVYYGHGLLDKNSFDDDENIFDSNSLDFFGYDSNNRENGKNTFDIVSNFGIKYNANSNNICGVDENKGTIIPCGENDNNFDYDYYKDDDDDTGNGNENDNINNDAYDDDGDDDGNDNGSCNLVINGNRNEYDTSYNHNYNTDTEYENRKGKMFENKSKIDVNSDDDSCENDNKTDCDTKSDYNTKEKEKITNKETQPNNHIYSLNTENNENNVHEISNTKVSNNVDIPKTSKLHNNNDSLISHNNCTLTFNCEKEKGTSASRHGSLR